MGGAGEAVAIAIWRIGKSVWRDSTRDFSKRISR